MKLLLHWLRWDLCRFRWMLAAWTLLVLGYAAFLGWLHAGILTIDPDWMAWSGPIALLLGATELLMLFHLFSTDPAGGVDPFWKTRPPTGFAVAGSKLVLALGFFVVLPMVAWLTMESLCVKHGAVTHEWEAGVSWTRFLWLVQTLVVSVLALGAATVRTPWQIPLKLGMGFALALLPVLLFLLSESLWKTGALSLMERAAGVSITPYAFWLWILAGCGVFWLARVRRAISLFWHGVVVLVPSAMLLLAFALPLWRPAPELPPVLAHGDPAAAGRIEVKGTLRAIVKSLNVP